MDAHEVSLMGLGEIRGTLNKVAESLERRATILENAHASFKKLTLAEALQEWYQLREAHEALDSQRKRINAVLEEMSRNTIPQMMAENSCKTFTHKVLGRRFTVNVRNSCTMVDKTAGITWLRENGHDGIIQETVNSSTLTAFATKLLEDQGIDLPEFFKMNSMNYTSATKI